MFHVCTNLTVETACVGVKLATFEKADRKATEARYKSDLSTTEMATDAGSDMEPHGCHGTEKRIPKRKTRYSPEPPNKRTKQKAVELPEALASDNLPPIPSSLQKESQNGLSAETKPSTSDEVATYQAETPTTSCQTYPTQQVHGATPTSTSGGTSQVPSTSVQRQLSDRQFSLANSTPTTGGKYIARVTSY